MLLGGWGLWQTVTEYSQVSYNQATTNLIPLSSQEILKKDFTKLKDDMNLVYIYFGRDTCQDCIKFKPILLNFLNEHKLKIYYYDTDKKDSNFTDIMDKYEIQSVPTLVKLKNQELVGVYPIVTTSKKQIVEQLIAIF